MRTRSAVLGLASLGVAALATTAAFALAAMQSASDATQQATQQTTQQATQSEAPTAAEMEQAMQAWLESMKPTKEHAALADEAGTWDVTMTVFGMGPAPVESKARATTEVVLGGKFLAEEFEGEMMGMPMKGLSLLTYDPVRKQYVMTWADSISSTIMRMTGAASKEGDVLTFFGEMDEPMTGEIGKTVKLVRRMKDKDHYTAEMWEVMYGEPFKVWEAVYTRAK